MITPESDEDHTLMSIRRRLDRLESLMQGLLPEDPSIKATHSRCKWCGTIAPTDKPEIWDWHGPDCDWLGLMG